MKNLIFVSVLYVLFLSCEKYTKTCNCDNPIEDLAWLKELKSSSYFDNCFCEPSLFQATYNKQTVFYKSFSVFKCDGIMRVELLDCEGNNIRTYEALTSQTIRDFNEEVTNQKQIYVCSDK